jgi:hypothetical protein
LKHDGQANYTRYEHGREAGLSGRTVPSDTLTYFWKDEEEHETEKEWLDERANHELTKVLLEYNKVAQE